MTEFLDNTIKDVLTRYPGVGKILDDYGVGCVTCGVASCLLKDVVEIHNIDEEAQAELMYKIEKEMFPTRNIPKPVVSRIPKKAAIKKLKYSPPVKCLVDEHVHIMKVVSSITKAALNIDAATEYGKQFVLDAVEFIRIYADKFHHMKEEDILFDYCERNTDIIKAILQDHITARGYIRAALGALEKRDSKGVFDNLTQYGNLLTEHIKKEDEILYPWIDRGLSTAQVGEMFSKFNEAEEKIDKEIIVKCLKFSENIDERIKTGSGKK
jgi:hemerythrin-like domain-containing protein